MSRRFWLIRRRPPRRQVFPFIERSRRRILGFKLAIGAATILIVAGLFIASNRGRYLAISVANGSRQLVRRAAGIQPERSEIDAEWRRYRRQGIENTTREFRNVFAEIEPPLQRLMRYSGNDPETGLLRWGNYSSTLLLPSTIFTADETGRSYRLRPNMRAVWLRNLTIQRIPLTFFLVPDGPGLKQAMKETSDSGSGIGPDDQLLGSTRTGTGPFGSAPRHRLGRLVHAGPVHRR